MLFFLSSNKWSQADTYQKKGQIKGQRPSVADKNLGAINFISRSGESGYKLYVKGASTFTAIISGLNHTLSGTLAGNGNQAALQTDLSKNKIISKNVILNGNPNKKGNYVANFNPWQWLNYFKHTADITVTQNTTWQNETLGGPDDYKIVYVNNAQLTLGTNFKGYGVLAISDSNPTKSEPILKMLSNATWYGLIIIYQSDLEGSNEKTYIKLNGQEPLNIKDCVIVAQNSCFIGNKVKVQSGNVVLNKEEGELTTQNHIKFQGSIYADKIRAGNHNTVLKDVGYNSLIHGSHFKVKGDYISPISLPLLGLPDFPSFTAGQNDIKVESYQTRYLNPGDYKNITLAKGATLYLNGGRYNIRSITASNSAKIEYITPVTLRITQGFTLGSYARIEPYLKHHHIPPIRPFLNIFYLKTAEGAPLLSPSPRPEPSPLNLDPTDCMIYITNNGFSAGDRSTLKCNIYAPNSNVKIGGNSTFQGAIIARTVDIGAYTKLRLKSGFGTVYIYGSIVLGGRLFYIPYGGGNLKVYYSKEALDNVEQEIQQRTYQWQKWKEKE